MDIKFIIPVTEYNINVKKSLTNLLKTNDKPILIISSQDIVEKIDKNIVKTLDATNVTFHISDNSTKQGLINDAVAVCENEYISVLNYEDEYSPNWLMAAEKYMNDYDASVYLPLVELSKDEMIVGLGNAIAWSPSFTDTDHLGYIENDGLKDYKLFMGDGSIIKRDSFVGLNPDSGFYAWHEFIAKTTSLNQKVFVIPKIGYIHAYEEHTDSDAETQILERIIKEYIKDDNTDE